jgi:hypothetical protein
MMKLILRKNLFKPTLLAFATALVIVFPTAASAMPMTESGNAVTPRAFVAPSTTVTDGWYSAALQQTPLTDGWYTAAVHQTPLTDGWYSSVVKAPVSSTPTVATPTSTNDSPYRNIGIVLAFGLLLAALLATAARKTRRDRHIPVLQ